ncbi:hypothetical protein GOHSU_14_01310 [Gordonia hirsuta DSM 44140 = NBRC 16056]|uniref:Uncharacterized protein n=1 Tax=Gordonia hirsuta DSM 44140 = NBRC 16056 TaxID=1121927 RepID=L7L7U2_9ACTN|nr:hypothetical protein [Gordonia hirsuta]GAC56964.1 hypothetical protein GOHSU_14_01310 [Gordonia hirsuta DSM 44140 = NBRC 16056]
MRSLSAGLLVVIAAIAMVVALPSLWVSLNVVSPSGFADSAADAAEQPEVQEFFAQQISDEVASSTSVPLAGDIVKPLAERYTRSQDFVTDFTLIARQQHDWLFTAPGPGVSRHQMELDITPMVNNVLGKAPIPVDVAQQVTVPVDQNHLTAGSLEAPGKQVTVVGWVALVVAVLAGVLALTAGRNRAGVLAWLGVGAALAGLVGWVLSVVAVDQVSRSVTGSDAPTQTTVKVVTADVLDGLTRTSMIVGIVGVVVAVLGTFAALILSRRPGPQAPAGPAYPSAPGSGPGYPGGRGGWSPDDPTVQFPAADPTVRHRNS